MKLYFKCPSTLETIEFEIYDMNPVLLRTMWTNVLLPTRCIFLSLVVKEPQLSAHEWWNEVPVSVIEEIMSCIDKYLTEECYV